MTANSVGAASAALSLSVTDPRLTIVEGNPAEPFPDRITAGSDRAAATLRSHEASARAQMEREAARVEANADRDDERQRDRAHVAATKYRSAACQARAFARLAELHEAQQMPSPLFTVKTQRHVRTLLSFGSFTGEVETALKSALRWTHGLPMRRRTGFAIMREGVERLGLLCPVVLPLAVAQALQEPSPEPPDAPPTATTAEHPPETVEGQTRPERAEWIAHATEHARAGWIGRVVQFGQIDFAEAFERGLGLSHAVQAARDWITGALVFGPLPFAWGRADGTGRPFQRDATGRLHVGRPDADGSPTRGDDPEPADGGGGTPPAAPDPTGGGGERPHAPDEPQLTHTDDARRQREAARADKLDRQAETAERRAEAQRNLYAGMNLTRRRARHRAAGTQEAERLTIYATALRAVAQAVRTRTCPAVLSRVTTRAHVERLVGVPSGTEGTLTTPAYPDDGPAPHEWQAAARDKSRRAFARMGIESADQFERAVAALAALVDGRHDPEAEGRTQAARIERMVESARLAGIPGYFRTPPTLVETVLAASGLTGTGRGVRILEPSAGDGALLDAVRAHVPQATVDAVEPSHALCQIIEAKGHPAPFGRRFEHFEPSALYDLVLMTPEGQRS